MDANAKRRLRMVVLADDMRVDGYSARVIRLAMLDVVRAWTVRHVHVLPEVEMVGRVVWDARLAAARAALRARVVEEWAATGGALRLSGARLPAVWLEPAVAIVGAATAGDTGPGWWTCFAVRGAGGRLLAIY